MHQITHQPRNPGHGWRPIVIDGIELFNISSVPVTRYRWRGTTIPSARPTENIEPAA